jgi:hypothetical protein
LDEQLYNATCFIRYKVTPRDILWLTWFATRFMNYKWVF